MSCKQVKPRESEDIIQVTIKKTYNGQEIRHWEGRIDVTESETEDFHEWLKIQGYDLSCERHVTHMFSDGTCRYSIIKGNRWESNREANVLWSE